MTDSQAPVSKPPDIHQARIRAATMDQICQLSETLSPAQRNMVADNLRSIAQAHCSPRSWMQAIYADEMPIGFTKVYNTECWLRHFDLGTLQLRPDGSYQRMGTTGSSL